VHYRLDARLQPFADTYQFSDLVVVPEPRAGAGPRPTALNVIDSDRIVAFLEGRHQNAAALKSARVSVEIVRTGHAQPLLSAVAKVQGRAEGTHQLFAATIVLSALPPGEYLARAIVTTPGSIHPSIDRPFRVERPAAVSAATAGNSVRSIAPTAAPLLQLQAVIPRFSIADVLRPTVVSQFIDALAKRSPPSAAIVSVVQKARAGEFTATPAASSRGDQDDAMLSFVKGLAALQAKQLPLATAFFQQTLRGAPGFVGVAFYLGACHAASGRDREALGAWQMSLLSEGADSVYPMLVDASLRLGESQKALDLLSEAPGVWTTPQSRLRREALAEAMVGHDTSAVLKIGDLIQQDMTDANLIFVGIQLLYRMHIAGVLSDADRATFADWTKRYEASDSPNWPLVSAWRDHVLK
jgi:hypothetical protein